MKTIKNIRLLFSLMIIGCSIQSGYAQYAFDREISTLSQNPAIPTIKEYAGINIDISGNIIITDKYRGVIYKVNPAYQLLSVIGTPLGTQGLDTPMDIVTDVQGNIYVTDKNRVIKYSNSGTYLLKWGSTGTGNGQFNNITGIDVSSSGNVYVSEANRVQIFSSTGSFIKSCNVSLYPNTSINQIAVDASGDIYAVYGSNVIKIIYATGAVSAISGSGSADGQFLYPTDLDIDAAGNVWVADAGNHRMQKISPTGVFMFKFGTPGQTVVNVNNPTAVEVAPSGNLYLLDGFINTFKSNGTWLSYETFSGSSATTYSAWGIALHSYGYALIPDYEGYKNTKWFNSATGEYFKTTDPHSSRTFQNAKPIDAEIGFDGDIFILDQGNREVHRYSSTGTYKRSFPSNEMELIYPTSIARSEGEWLFIGDRYSHTIRTYTPLGTFLYSFGYSNLVSPMQIAVDVPGNVYVADSSANRVAKFNGSGVFIQYIGNTPGELETPTGVTIDEYERLHVADKTGMIKIYDLDGNYIGEWHAGVSLSRITYLESNRAGKIYVSEASGRVSIYTQTPVLNTRVNTGQRDESIISEATIDFGNQTLNVASAPYVFTIKNTQPGTVLEISAITINGVNASAFQLDETSTLRSQSLSYGASTTFMISCLPDVPGELNAIVEIISNDLNNPTFAFYLTGNTPKLNQVITIDPISDKTYGENPFNIQVNTTSSGSVVYTTTTNVDLSGNQISILGAGNVTIEAFLPETPSYNSAVATQSFYINKATLQVKAEDVTRAEGTENPQFIYSYSGFVYNDNNASISGIPVLSTDATLLSAAGAYDITVDVSNLSSNNYSFVPVNAILTVTQVTSAINSSNEKLLLYPNPSDGSFEIYIQEEVHYVRLINTLGHEEIIYSNQIHTKMKGLVMVRVVTDKGEYISRMVVE